jgi:hypothetical protein
MLLGAAKCELFMMGRLVACGLAGPVGVESGLRGMREMWPVWFSIRTPFFCYRYYQCCASITSS